MDTVCFGTLGGSATLDAKLGARSHERHSYHDLARSHGVWGSDLEFRCRSSWTHSHLAWGIGAIPGEPASGRSAFDQRGSRPRREGLRLSIRKYRAWRGNANSARERIVRSLNDSERDMRNEHQENGVPRGPLILLVPVSNFVAVMNLDWLDGTNRAASSA
jgi:hypothetical protein